MPRRFPLLAALALLAFAGPAVADPIDTSTITSPAAGHLNPDFDASPSVMVTGTTTNGNEPVKIICDFGDGFYQLAANVPLQPDGSFSASVNPGSAAYATCPWRAVDNEDNSGFAGFNGPLIGVGGYDDDMGSGANAGKLIRVTQIGGGAGGYTFVRTFTESCFLGSMAPRDAASLVYPTNLLNCIIPSTGTANRTFKVDGVNAMSADDSAGDAGAVTGLQRSFDTASGDFVVSWTETTGICEPTCTPGPFRLDTSSTTTNGGRVVRIAQGWRNTDSAPHTITLRYLLDLTGTPGYRFPGESGYATHAAAQTGAFPAAPATVRLASGVATIDGATNQTRASLTTRPKPDSFTFTDGNTGAMVWERVVPAGGELRLVLYYANGFLQSDVDGYIAAAEAELVPAVAFTGSDALTTTTVTGTVSDAAGGLPAVAVNGVAASVASNGTWSATLPLTAGANNLSAVAAIDGVSSTTATRTVTYTPPGSGDPGTQAPGGGTQDPGGGGSGTPTFSTPTVAKDGQGVTVNVTCPGAGTLTGTLTQSGSARAAAKNKKSKVLGKATKKVAAAGTVRFTVRLSAQGKRLLRKRGTLKAKLKVSFKPATGATTTKTVAVTLKRKKKPKG